MTMINDLLEKQMEEIKKKMEELRPVHEQYVQLENVLKVMRAGIAGKINFLEPAVHRGKPGPKLGAGRRAGYRAAESFIAPRQEEALAIVKNLPGITPPDLGKKMGIHQTSARRLLRMLEERGALRKEYFSSPEGNHFKVSKYFPVEEKQKY